MPAALPDGVRVVASSDQQRLVCRRPIAAGEAILWLNGVVVPQPTRYTVQVGRGQHVAPEDDGKEGRGPSPERFPWCYLDHACRPNARFEGRTLVARCAIEPGEAITFDYTTTEFEMASPFPCHCGASDCLRIVRGWRHLTNEQRWLRQGDLAAHLRAAWAEQEWIGRPDPA